jgi:hypothetical protein
MNCRTEALATFDVAEMGKKNIQSIKNNPQHWKALTDLTFLEVNIYLLGAKKKGTYWYL